MNDSELLDVVIEGFGLKNDAELSRFLGLSRAAISKIRNREKNLGPLQKLKVLDKIAFLSVCNWVERLSPSKLGDLLRKTNHELAHRRVKLNNSARYAKDAELVSLAKESFEFDSDKELAKYLGLQPTSISGIKAGRSSLGLMPRLKILEQISPKEASQLKGVLSSSQNLAIEIKRWISQGHKA